MNGTLGEPVSSVIERERKTLDRLLDACGRRVVLFGAGGLGKQTSGLGLRTIGIEPLAFSDNNSSFWGTEVDGLRQSFSPKWLQTGSGKEALFIVAIWNPRHWYSETLQQLRAVSGCEQIVPPSPVYWRFPEIFLPFYAQDLPRKVGEQSADVLEAASLWTDARSQQEFLQQVRWRVNGEWTFSLGPQTGSLTFRRILSNCSQRRSWSIAAHLTGTPFKKFPIAWAERFSKDLCNRTR